MKAALAAAAVVVACAAKPVKPVERVVPAPTIKPHEPVAAAVKRVRVPRPEIDIDVSTYFPDTHDELRWPLPSGTHPVLEPHFPIARELAQPGIEWTALCTGPVLARHVVGTNANDLMEYLRGWCAALAHDPDGALDHFARVRGSIVAGLSAALTYDVAFVLADETADKAESLLQKRGLQQLPVLDMLAATYVEIGRDDDARQINRRALAFTVRKDDAFCRRTTRDVLLGGDLEAFRLVTRATKNEACEELVAKLDCVMAHDCLQYYSAHNASEAEVAKMYMEWPTHALSTFEWSYFFDRQMYLNRWSPHVRQLALATVRAMARASDCSDSSLQRVREAANSIWEEELRTFDLAKCTALARDGATAP